MATMAVDEKFLEIFDKLKEIQIATLIHNYQHSFEYKDNIQEHLHRAKKDVSDMLQGIKSLRENLEEIKAENERCKEMSLLLETLRNKIDKMDKNMPSGLRNYIKLQESIVVPNEHLNYDSDENVFLSSKAETFTPSAHSSIRDCKKFLFKDSEICPLLTPLTQEEFSKIPKYIIGRQTLEAINSLISCINQILKAKYTLLSLGKDGARKKGDLDLYLEYKKQQTIVKEGEGKVYFFTAEDYQKHTSSKLDKIKLNILTALRSCKKIREIRMGKLLYYMVVSVD